MNMENKESSGDFLQRVGMDGNKWAEEMHKCFPSVPEDELLGWCCNMIMAGYDEAVRRTTKPITPEERQKAVEVMADKISNEMLKGATYAGHFDMVLKQQAAALTALEAAGFVVRRG